MKIIEELWYGHIRPNDRAFQKDTRIAELTELVARNEDELVSCLDNDEKDIFHKYQAIRGELKELCECEIFIKGFRLGMQLTVEGMKGSITEP